MEEKSIRVCADTPLPLGSGHTCSTAVSQFPAETA